MAVEELPDFAYHPRLPDRDKVDPRAITVEYEQTSDTLFVHFYGRSRSAISILMDDDIYFRVDPVTEDVVGVQVEYYLSHAVREHPELLIFAEFANIPASLIEQARSEIDSNAMRASALNSVYELLSRA